MRRILATAVALASASTALAQSQFDLGAQPAQSNFTWTGSTSVGPIVGNPSNQFQVVGHNGLALLASSSAGVKWNATLTGGVLLVVPDIHGKIPNPLPFLPPLATIAIAGLRLSLSSFPFDVAQDGTFSAQVTALILSGNMTITPLTGGATVTDLAGAVSNPTLQSGTLTGNGLDLDLLSLVHSTFDFDDPSSGIAGSVTIDGTLAARWTCPPVAPYCAAKLTSSGCLPSISAQGTPSASAASGFVVRADGVEPSNLGLVFYSRTGSAALPFQGGTLCVAPQVFRLPPQSAGGAGPCSGAYTADFNAWIATNVPSGRLPGAEYWVQAWFRDPPDATSGTGLSNGLAFTLCP